MYNNFHTHTYRCHHADGDIKDYLLFASLSDCGALGFSDHCPFPADTIDNWQDIRMSPEESHNYIKAINKQKGKWKFPLYAGFECEWSTRYKSWYTDFLIGELNADYLILGPHWVEYGNEFVYAPQFGDKKLLHLYVDNTIQAMLSGLFKFVAHPDLAMSGWQKWDSEAVSCFSQIIDCAIDCNLPLEINGQGMLKPQIQTPQGMRFQYPYDEFWLLAKSKGATIICSSDAHNPENVIEGVKRAYDFANKLGISPKTFSL